MSNSWQMIAITFLGKNVEHGHILKPKYWTLEELFIRNFLRSFTVIFAPTF